MDGLVCGTINNKIILILSLWNWHVLPKPVWDSIASFGFLLQSRNMQYD